MKILVVGKDNIMKWPFKVVKGFSDLGHETDLFVFNQKTFAYCYWRLLGKKRRLHWLAEKFQQKITSFKPDLIVYVSFAFIPLELYKAADSFNIKKVGWAADKFEPKMKEKADFLDALFCTDTGYLEYAKSFKCPSYYLPLCADTDTFKNEHLPKTLPPFFAGVANKLRNEYFGACKEKCLLYGKGWDKQKMPWHEIHNHKIPLEKMQHLINQSIAPINICFSPNIVNGLNFRVFEIGACGGLIMVNETKDLSLCYDIGKEAVVYTTPDDFNRLLKDIVENPKKYKKIASAGYKRTMKDHTYFSRLNQMLNYIKK